MKKLLSITSSVILSGSAVTILATNVNTYQATEKIQNNSNISWTGVQNDSNNYFKNIKENYYKNPKLKLIKDNKEVDINKVIKYAQVKANDYIAKFQNQNLDLSQIITTLSKDSREFVKNYNSTLNQLLVEINATAAAGGWAFPIVFAIIPVASVILAWINLYS